MKWVRIRNSRSDSLLGRARKSLGNLTEEQLQRLEALQRKNDNCFKDYKEDEFKKIRHEQFDVWADHEFDGFFEKKEHYEQFQERYQLFCGGYLHFYDSKNRSGLVDHQIFFEWSNFKPAAKEIQRYNVKIFMSPKPLKYKEPPLNGKPSKKKLLSSQTTEEDAVDPPKPPPPPPPEM